MTSLNDLVVTIIRDTPGISRAALQDTVQSHQRASYEAVDKALAAGKRTGRIEYSKIVRGWSAILLTHLDAAAKSEPEEELGSVDAFIWTPRFSADQGESYARWMLMHFRLPAHMQAAVAPFIADRRLFCTHDGERYRVTGASRMGDVWLAKDFARNSGYDMRVQVETCSVWGAEP